MSFGELALMYNSPRAATVTAKETSNVFKLDRGTFKAVLMDTTTRKREAYKGFLEKVPSPNGRTPLDCANFLIFDAPQNYSRHACSWQTMRVCVVQS